MLIAFKHRLRKGRKTVDNFNHKDDLKSHYMGIGVAVGLCIGVVFSLLFAVVMKRPGMLGVGAGIGVSIGIAIGEGLYQQNKGR